MTVAPRLDDVTRVLAALDGNPSPAAYVGAARDLEALSSSESAVVRVSLLASFTIQPLMPYLAVEMARVALRLDSRIGPFNAVIQELIGPSSTSVAHGAEIVVVAQLLDDVAPELARDFPTLTSAAVDELSARVVSDAAQAIESFRRNSTAGVVVQSFTPPPRATAGSGYALAPNDQQAAVRALNARLAEAVGPLADVHVFDFERVVGEIGTTAWWDDRTWHLARAPLSARALPVVAQRLAAMIAAVSRPARKCLVVDLDDTLWGGVLGEAGPLGVKIGPEYPGSVFRDVQRMLRGLRQTGVLLAINSKNNLADVQQVFAANRAMVLTLDDFAAVEANWRSKPENMLAIARRLNIGLDSLVFVDDNPAERAMMREALPEVLTIDLPDQAVQFAAAIAGCRAFDRLWISEEDHRRGDMYRENHARREFESSSLDVDRFLAGLNMQVAIQSLSASSMPRAADLVRKTNQFNLTTRRHSQADVAIMMQDSAYGLFTVRVSDRFGDNGLVGVAIVRDDGAGCVWIDTLLLSCRVIGRKVETAMLAHLHQWARARGARTLRGEFVATAKNAPAADCYASHGFAAATGDAGLECWDFDVARDMTIPEYLSVSIDAPK